MGKEDNMAEQQKVCVIGAGTMGNGIAHVFALGGWQVSLMDISEEQLQKALATIEKNMDRQVKKGVITEEDKKQALARITTTQQLAEAVAGASLVVEAVVENAEVKKKIFAEVEQTAGEDTILASNTSSISISELASATRKPERVVGMHFFNPVPVMKLVEVVRGLLTGEEVVARVVAVARQLGKEPVIVNDYPGFVSNRILMPMINEAIYALWEGVAGVEEIDTVMRLGMNHPMGPLALADLIGLDVCLYIMEVLHSRLGVDRYAPCPLLRLLVAAGKLGRKTGEGFYLYREAGAEPSPTVRRLTLRGGAS